ncbi:ribonuclease P protein subunit p25-like protein [Cyclospora cayetanensis]|uniref:Ribonuclease P protein subunit p25-like protein n=1 Tax=Cyclospora cayetanensis TaxID=88456 RepID=A0A6P6RSF4_9EIME|nr:ribonuclease P protein subunit p25-like protein [Cyclospora cayetanensis]
MEKYRRVRAAREPLGSDEIRVTATGRVMNYVSYAGTLITDQKMRQLTIKASGNAIGQAIALAEQLKRRYKGLHQLNTCGNTTVSLVYEPLEEGLDEVTEERVVAFLEIKLSFDPLDENNPGYQPPLDEATINEFKPQAAPGPGGKAHQRAGQNVDPKWDVFVAPEGLTPCFTLCSRLHFSGPSRGRGGFRGGMRGRGGPRNLGSGGEGEGVDGGAREEDAEQTQAENTGFRGRGRGRGGFRGAFRGGYRGAPRGGPRGPRGGRSE